MGRVTRIPIGSPLPDGGFSGGPREGGEFPHGRKGGAAGPRRAMVSRAGDARDGRWGLEVHQIDLSVGRRAVGWGIPPWERRRVNGQVKLMGLWGKERILGLDASRVEGFGRGARGRSSIN